MGNPVGAVPYLWRPVAAEVAAENEADERCAWASVRAVEDGCACTLLNTRTLKPPLPAVTRSAWSSDMTNGCAEVGPAVAKLAAASRVKVRMRRMDSLLGWQGEAGNWQRDATAFSRPLTNSGRADS